MSGGLLPENTTALKHANTHANTHETPNANNHANTHHMDGGPVPMYDFQQNPEFVAFPLQQNHEFGGFQPVQQNHEFSGFPPPLQQNQEFLDLPSMYNSPPSQFQIPNSIYIPREPEAQLPTTMCMEREIQAQLPVTIYEILRDNMSHGFQSHSPTEKSIVENNLSLHMGMCQTNDDNFQNADGSSPSDLTSNYSSNQDNMNVPQETGNFFQKFPGLYPNIGPNMQPMGAFNPTFGLPGGLQVVKDGEADSGLPLPHMRLDLDGES
ncbi:MAG: hypothetical protein M1834_002940 [Cirrosporium novae-zelandiae]|nr:MAG: hypothetical protein M1834_002940 [Cirrosporium novae-zelandiae]